MPAPERSVHNTTEIASASVEAHRLETDNTLKMYRESYIYSIEKEERNSETHFT